MVHFILRKPTTMTTYRKLLYCVAKITVCSILLQPENRKFQSLQRKLIQLKLIRSCKGQVRSKDQIKKKKKTNNNKKQKQKRIFIVSSLFYFLNNIAHEHFVK